MLASARRCHTGGQTQLTSGRKNSARVIHQTTKIPTPTPSGIKIPLASWTRLRMTRPTSASMMRAKGNRYACVKNRTTRTAMRVPWTFALGRSTTRMASPSAIAKSPSAARKSTMPQCESTPHTGSSPQRPRNGDFRRPQQSTINPAGRSASNNAAASLVATIGGSTIMNAAESA